jgi:hypothetical protein
MNSSIRTYIFLLSVVLTLAGATLYLTDRIHAPYLFAAGTAGITVCFMTLSGKNLGIRRRRLLRINVIAGISMIAASVLMFRGRMEWVVCLFIAALLLIYTSFINPRADE